MSTMRIKSQGHEDRHTLKCNPQTQLVTVVVATVVRRGDIAANNETFHFPMPELLFKIWLSPFISPGLINLRGFPVLLLPLGSSSAPIPDAQIFINCAL